MNSINKKCGKVIKEQFTSTPKFKKAVHIYKNNLKKHIKFLNKNKKNYKKWVYHYSLVHEYIKSFNKKWGLK